jgi:hypothetical protein
MSTTNAPEPVQEIETPKLTQAVEITFVDPAWDVAFADNVITDEERGYLIEEGNPVFIFEIGNDVYEWNAEFAQAKRHAQVLDVIPNGEFYEDFPIELKGTSMIPKEQLSYHSAQMVDDTFDWEFQHPTDPEVDACSIYEILQTTLYMIDNDTGFFAQYMTDVLESWRFGMFCPPAPTLISGVGLTCPRHRKFMGSSLTS